MAILNVITAIREKHYDKVMKTHTKKISRLLSRETDVDKLITNLSSHRLSFFEKLVLCRGLKFSLPQQTSAKEVMAGFEKAYWRAELSIPNEKRELAAATLRSIAFNYIQRKGPKPPKLLLRAIERLKRLKNIVITKPDKGNGVVLMDREEYINLLSEASVNNLAKFKPASPNHPKKKGRPPKYYHPLFEKEKMVSSVIRKHLLKVTADKLYPQGSRLAHLYGLPKTHKAVLRMHPILSSTATYNFTLAEWLNEKLGPLSINDYMIQDIFEFADNVRNLDIQEGDIFVSYDVSSLFTNVPVDETIDILVERAFHENWFNKNHGTNLQPTQLRELLQIAVKNQLFQFDGNLYEQVDGVAMGSPLGPLMANTFMTSTEAKLKENGKIPEFYKRYVDDTFAVVSGIAAAETLFEALNNAHPLMSFTMEIEMGGKLPFLGMTIIREENTINTEVYRKPTNTGLLLHYQSHTDERYKRSLLRTMLYRAHRLSSSMNAFTQECKKTRTVISRT